MQIYSESPSLRRTVVTDLSGSKHSKMFHWNFFIELKRFCKHLEVTENSEYLEDENGICL